MSTAGGYSTGIFVAAAPLNRSRGGGSVVGRRRVGVVVHGSAAVVLVVAAGECFAMAVHVL